MLVKLQQDSLLGTVLDGTYEIISIIGHGGMGVVYKARHKLMDRVVAIKMLKSTLISDSMSVKRFQQEVKATARIGHPHAITVYDFGISPEGLPYIVMDYLQGQSLADVIKAAGHIEVDRGVRIIMQACEALAHAHKQGVVHRDLKPSNIVLTEYDDDPDFVKVVDFGVAKLIGGTAEGAQRLTQTGEVCGSPVYMSPEQCMGMELDLRSDIYSMGILIYETLSGKLPLIGRTMVDTMSKHVSEMPPPFIKVRPDLYIPERIEQVVLKAMAKDPNDRHQNMDELRDDLENAIPKPGRGSSLRATQSAMRDTGLTQTTPGPLSDRRLSIPVVIGGSIAALVVIILGIFGMVRSGAFTKQNAVTTVAPAAVVSPATTTPTTTPHTQVGAVAPAPVASKASSMGAPLMPAPSSPGTAAPVNSTSVAPPTTDIKAAPSKGFIPAHEVSTAPAAAEVTRHPATSVHRKAPSRAKVVGKKSDGSNNKPFSNLLHDLKTGKFHEE